MDNKAEQRIAAVLNNCGFKLGRNLMLVSLVHDWHTKYKIGNFVHKTAKI